MVIIDKRIENSMENKSLPMVGNDKHINKGGIPSKKKKHYQVGRIIKQQQIQNIKEKNTANIISIICN